MYGVNARRVFFDQHFLGLGAMSPWSSKGLHMFDLDQFVADCRSARGTDCPSKTIGEVIKRTVSDPAGLLKVLGEPDRAGIKELYRASDLSILNVVWAPRMMIMPHNHHMWANIGVYVGREDNIFWRRIAKLGERRSKLPAPLAGREKLAAARRRHYPLGHQPDIQIHCRDPRLRRRFLCRPAQ